MSNENRGIAPTFLLGSKRGLYVEILVAWAI